MKCDQIQPDLLDYGRGLLNGAEAREIRAHIASCSECAALLEEEMSFAQRLCVSPEEQTPRDVWALVRSKTKPRRVRMPSFAWLGGLRPVRRALAAVAMVAVGVALYGLNMEQPIAPNASSVQRQATQPIGQQAAPGSGSNIVVVKWSDDPLGNHTDAMVDVIDDM